jgi:hypothetical protein
MARVAYLLLGRGEKLLVGGGHFVADVAHPPDRARWFALGVDLAGGVVVADDGSSPLSLSTTIPTGQVAIGRSVGSLG